MRSTLKERFSEQQSDSSNNSSFNNGSQFQDDNEQHHVLLFIKQAQDGRLQLQQDCLEIISSTEQPISFICILGENYSKYGEIANEICEIKWSGFLNQSIRGNEGAWMYTKPSYNAKTNSVVYYILVKQSQQQHINPKILSLISLISGSIIYVAKDPLNTHSLDLLRFTSELQQHIIFNSKDFSFQLEELMPTLNWLIITDKKSSIIKNQIQQYLQGFDANKKAIKTFFKNRLVYTISSSQQDKRKNQLGQNKKKILINTSNKALQYHNIESGFIAAIMIQKLADNISTDAIRLDQIWKQINNAASKTAYHSAVSHYIQMYQNNFASEEPKGEQLYDMLKQMKNQTIQEFDRNAIKGQSQTERVKLFDFLQNHEVSIVQANLTACQMHNLKLLKDIKTKVQTNYKNGKYVNKQMLDRDMKQYIDKYNEEGKGPNKQTILNKFQSNFRGVFQVMIQEKPPIQVNDINPPNLIFTLGAPEPSHVRQLEDKVQQLQRKLQSKQINNSLVMKKQLQRVQLQNQVIRNQITNLNNKKSLKPKTQKCCLLF